MLLIASSYLDILTKFSARGPHYLPSSVCRINCAGLWYDISMSYVLALWYDICMRYAVALWYDIGMRYIVAVELQLGDDPPLIGK
jgi:hypothetical protein